MHWVMVSAGPISGEEKEHIHAGDFIVACDAGWRSCEALGVVPNLVVGDFDSSPQPEATGEQIVLPHVKDDTDTHFAAREALRRGAEAVTMLGALGGKRMEHTLANLSTALWLEKQGIKTELVDARSHITFVRPGAAAEYHKGKYSYFSVFPAEGRATGVELAGAVYPLHDAVLTADFPLGVSNEYAADTIRAETKTGYLMVIETVSDR